MRRVELSGRDIECCRGLAQSLGRGACSGSVAPVVFSDVLDTLGHSVMPVSQLTCNLRQVTDGRSQIP